MKDVEVGTVFRFGNEDQGWGIGQVYLSKINLFVVVFDRIFQNKDEADFKGDWAKDPLLYGWTMDGRLYSGQWEVLAIHSVVGKFVYPSYKVIVSGEPWITDVFGTPKRKAKKSDTETIQNKFSVSPITFEDAFFAHHEGKWDDYFDKLLVPHSAAL